MGSERSFVDIFETMDSPARDVSLEVYGAWRSKMMISRLVGITYLEAWCTSTDENDGGSAEWHSAGPDLRKKCLLKFVGTMRKQLFAECLCSASFSLSDSKKIVELLMKQFQYSALRCLPEFQAREQLIVDVIADKIDIPILGQILGPILTTGSSVHLLVDEKNKFLEFFYLIGECLADSGLPPGSYIIADSVSHSCGTRIRLRGDSSTDSYCPMIVHEDADVDSAVESIIQGSWDFSGTLTWSLTHVYVQESIFVDVVEKLKNRLSLLKHGSRFVKGTNLCEEPYFEEHRDFGSMEVFKALRDCPHVLFIGWDPSTAGLCNLKPGVSLLPYRTISEAIALVNQSRYTCAASVWTERISTASITSDKLEVGTVWINCHGLIDPKVPFGSRKQFKYPANGDELLYSLVRATDVEPSLVDCHPTSTSIFYRKDIHTAVEMALTAQKSWSALESAVRCEKIALACEALKTALPDLEEKYGEMTSLDVASLLTRSELPSSEMVMLAKHRVLLSLEPFRIVVLTVTANPQRSLDDFALLSNVIVTVLTHGSSVVVYVPHETGEALAAQVCGLFETCNLPQGLLNIVSRYEPNSKMDLQIVGRFLTLGSRISRISGQYFGENIVLSHRLPSEIGPDLVYQKKATWYPNK